MDKLALRLWFVVDLLLRYVVRPVLANRNQASIAVRS